MVKKKTTKRKSSVNTFNSKTKNLLKERGYEVDSAERWVSFGGKGGIRKDLFGFIDLVAMKEGEILGVQVTGKSHASSRRKKILASNHAYGWLSAGGRILLSLWEKRGNRWKHTEEWIELSQFPDEVSEEEVG